LRIVKFQREVKSIFASIESLQQNFREYTVLYYTVYTVHSPIQYFAAFKNLLKLNLLAF